MRKKLKARITSDGVEGFFSRSREHARKLDRGEELSPEFTISFENAADMMKVLSPERLRLLRTTKEGAMSVSRLADELKRDTRAVGRDVNLLEQLGLLRTRYRVNPGHGRLRIVEPRAARYQLVATV
ncbi:MAG TPA: HTH domain-containing protein [Terriglobales bacterium]|nr:HTH domain-containing protein [Terriglobales bacterium]